MNNIYTFWEGPMPDYIKLCMRTWKHPYTLLTFDNLHEYTNLKVDERLTRFTRPQIADAIRVHVLRDQGGYWLDADTIMISDKLPEETILGNNEERTNSIGYLHTEPHSEMFESWAVYQDFVIDNPKSGRHWSVMGNTFTDLYLKRHTDILIGDIGQRRAEMQINPLDEPFVDYCDFYFFKDYHLSDIKPTDLLMLHNSWTPDFYKKLTEEEIMNDWRTLSNFLRELL